MLHENRMLNAGVVATAIITAFDKFTDRLENWDVPVKGAVESASGFLEATAPKLNPYAAGAWMAGAVASLWSRPEYRKVRARDVALALGALIAIRMVANAYRQRQATERAYR